MATQITKNQLPRIDFSGIDPAMAGGTGRWAIARDLVKDALYTYGCFEAIYKDMPQELRSSIFGPDIAEKLFALPTETKSRNIADKPYHGHYRIPALDYEGLAVHDPLDLDRVQDFCGLMWPGAGDPSFRDTVHAYANTLAAVDEMVWMMLMESLGVAEQIEERKESTAFILRLAEYKAPKTPEGKLGLGAHRDTSYLSVLSQKNGINGIEVETRDGEWIRPVLSPDSLFVLAGDPLKAFTNGRVYNPRHRVVVEGDVTRYSGILFSCPKDGFILQAPKEVIDEDHPSLYKPFEYNEYIAFCYTDQEREQADGKLEDYCAVRG